MNRRPMPPLLADLAHLMAPAQYGQQGLALLCRLLMVLLVILLGACAELPQDVQRPVSVALQEAQNPQDLALARIVDASTPSGQRTLSGFRLLPAGDQAFEARLALAAQASKTLDLQYYQLAHDGSGLQLLQALRQAAERGVRVRLLVDDLYAAGQDAALAGLAAQPNIDVRMFNPLPVRNAGFGSRIALSLHQFSRINRRMHNKLFVADNQVSISGGRNIADEYFGRSEPANFIDLDILATGPVVAEQSAVFDRYWNSPQAFPVQSLVPADFDAGVAQQAFDQQVRALVPPLPRPAADALGRSSVGEQLAAGRLDLQFATARLLADAPAKADADPGKREHDDGIDGKSSDGESTVAQAHLALLRSAQEEVMVASPYFVPGAPALAALQDAIDRRVQFSVMTNSLSTTDEPLVHVGYARYRNALLKMGVKLYELMPSLTGAAEQRPSAAPEQRGSLGRLHAKLAVVDRRFLYIGSMNMDRRSALTNTECGLIIDSPALAAEVAQLLQRERQPGSYRLRLQQAGGQERIEWVAGAGEREVVHQAEPQMSVGQSVRLWLTSRFVAEEML